MRTRGNTLYACLVIAGVTGLLLASISGPTPFFGLERGGVGERTGLGAGTSLVLLSDNVSSPTVPITTLILPPTSSNGWYTGPVDVSMSVYDPGTAGTTTYYQLDTGALTVYTGNFTISSDGVHTLNYYSIDSANNTEPTKRGHHQDRFETADNEHFHYRYVRSGDLELFFAGADDTVRQ